MVQGRPSVDGSDDAPKCCQRLGNKSVSGAELSSPLEFEWPVDARGYEWIERPARYVGEVLGTLPAEWEIHPRGGPLRYRRPTAGEPELFRQFAACCDREAVSGFVAKWGLLDRRDVQLLSAYLARADNLRVMLAAVANLGRDLVWPLLDARARPRLEAVTDASTSPPRICQTPVDLYNALLWQLRQAVDGSIEIRRCRNCGAPVFIGTGHRDARAEFCSPRCKVAAWRRRQRATTGGSRAVAQAGKIPPLLIASAAVAPGQPFGPCLIWPGPPRYPPAWVIGRWNGDEWCDEDGWLCYPDYWSPLPVDQPWGR
jgi:hypothetical protein